MLEAHLAVDGTRVEVAEALAVRVPDLDAGHTACLCCHRLSL
jgi:hypothetical protein